MLIHNNTIITDENILTGLFNDHYINIVEASSGIKPTCLSGILIIHVIILFQISLQNIKIIQVLPKLGVIKLITNYSIFTKYRKKK